MIILSESLLNNFT